MPTPTLGFELVSRPWITCSILAIKLPTAASPNLPNLTLLTSVETQRRVYDLVTGGNAGTQKTGSYACPKSQTTRMGCSIVSAVTSCELRVELRSAELRLASSRRTFRL